MSVQNTVEGHTAIGSEMPNPTATDLSVTSCSMLISPSTLLSILAREPVTPVQASTHLSSKTLCQFQKIGTANSETTRYTTKLTKGLQ